MKRLLIILALVIVLISPSISSDTPSDLDYYVRPMPNYMLGALGTEDYVDAISDLHSPTDVGTHSSFAEEQDYDGVFDTLTEADAGTSATNYEDFVDAISDLHTADTDVGTHSSFAEMQDKDGSYDTLTEGSTGSAATNYNDYVDGSSSNVDSHAGHGTLSNFANCQDGGDGDYAGIVEANTGTADTVFGYSTQGGSYTTVSANYAYGSVFTSSATISTITDAHAYGRGASATQNVKMVICLHSTLAIITNGVSSASSWTTTAGWKAFSWSTPPTLSASTEYLLLIIPAGSVRFYYGTGSTNQGHYDSTNSYTTPADLGSATHSTNQYSIYCHYTPNEYELDQEMNWASAQYSETNEEVCVKTGTESGDSEVIKVDVWDGVSEWVNIIASLSWSAWNNASVSDYLVSSSLTIRFVCNGKDYTATTINLDSVMLHCWTASTLNYDMDLEVGWTSAQYSETNEYLCVYAGTLDSDEAIRVDIWDSVGSAWVNLYSLTSGDEGWSNVSIGSYLNDATVEVRFTDTSDEATSQDAWALEGVLLHCWTAAVVNYRLDLEVGWTAVDYDESNEYLCVYAGAQNAEALKIDIWYSGAWTEIEDDIVASQWNNISITTYLTGSAVEIRFIDATQSSDSSQGTWQVEAVLIHTWTPNNAPVNDTSPTCSELDTTDNMYAHYKYYSVVVYVSDADGYSDIDYVDLYLYNDTRAVNYWVMRYDEDTNTFSEQSDASDYVDMSGSSASRTGNDIDATFEVMLHWTHPDQMDIDVRVVVYDEHSGSDDDFYEVDWDTETRLTYPDVITADDYSGTINRGGLDNSFSMYGLLSYYGTTNVYPSGSYVDVWVSAAEYGTEVGPWVDTTLTTGAFSVACYGDDVVGIDTYTIKPVSEGTGSGGSSLYYTTDETKTYISDRIQVDSYVASDLRDTINDNVNITVSLIYDYDDTAVTTGTVTINGYSATYGGTGWRITRTSSTVTSVIYDTVAASDTLHGISMVDQNGKDITIIWDRVTVASYSVSDSRDNINENVTIDATLQYDYDDAALTTGTVTINGYSASHLGSGVWRITRTSATVTSVTYDTVATGGDDTYGIGQTDQNGQSISVIWDRVCIVSYDSLGDHRGQCAGVGITAVYDYDDSPFDALSSWIEFNSSSSYRALQYTGNWFYGSFLHDTGNYSFHLTSILDMEYGLTVWTDDTDFWFIFDRIFITNTWVQYLVVGDDAVTYIYVTAELQYDGHPLGSGDILYINQTTPYSDWVMTWDAGNSRFYRSVTNTVLGNYSYYVFTGTEVTYGVAGIENESYVYIVWDTINLTLSINVNWALLGDNATMSAIGIYDFLGITWNGTISTTNSSSGTRFPKELVCGNYTFIVLSITNDDYALATSFTSLNIVYCFFDGVVISSGPSYFWTQYSPDAVWLVWGVASSYSWYGNSSSVPDGTMISSIMNGTANAEAATYGGSISGLAIGPFTSDWYHVNITVVVTVSGTELFLWYSILSVDIMHSIHVEDSGIDIQDDWMTFHFHTNWNNGTFTIWDNITGTPVEVGYSPSEGWYQIAKPSVTGTHKYIVLVNGTHSGATSASQSATGTSGDSWKYFFYNFVINPVTFSITDPFVLQNNVSIVFGGIFYCSDLTIDYTVYEDGVYVDSGVLTIPSSGSYYALRWTKTSATSTANWTVVMMSNSVNITVYGYNIIVDSSQYVTYNNNASYSNNEDTYYIDEIDAAQVATAEMWQTLGIMLTIVLAVIVSGVGFLFGKRWNGRRRPHDRSLDAFRSPMSW